MTTKGRRKPATDARQILFTKAGYGYELFTAPVDGDWLLIGYIVRQERDIVVGEVRIVPRSAVYVVDAVDGETRLNFDFLKSLRAWSGAAKGIYSDVPAGGVTSATLRKVQIGVVSEVRARLRARRRDVDVAAVMTEQATLPLIADEVHLGRARLGRTRFGRPPLTDNDLMPVAIAHHDAIKSGRSRDSIVATADTLDWDKKKVRSWVNKCREPEHDLLEQAKGPFGGGELTQKGLRLAAEMNAEAAKRRRARAKGQKRRRR